MKKVTQLSLAAAVASAASFATVAPASAEVSATVGVVSDYYFRGLGLGDAGAFVSLDYESNGLYAGAWAIDDGGINDGMEVDYYVGYGQETDAFAWNVGINAYTYTYTKDYEAELGLSLGVSDFSADLFYGVDEDLETDSDDNYLVLQLGYTLGAMSATVGHYELDDADTDYQWLELGWSGDLVEGIESGVNVGVAQDNGTDNDGYIFFTASKSFDL